MNYCKFIIYNKKIKEKTKYLTKRFIFVRYKTKKMENKISKVLWLLLSSFGIMFAVLSWLNESGLNFVNFEEIFKGSRKGWYALLSGFVLYFFLARKNN